jgi:hypothetical protein
MSSNDTQSQKDASGKLYAFVLEQLKAGVDKSTISQKLVATGIGSSDATQLVEKIHYEAMKKAREEQFEAGIVVPTLLGGGLAAIVGGSVWALIVIATGYEIGFVAWGIGILAGLGVVLFSKGQRGLPLQLIAVITSALGVVIGKYDTFFYFFRKAIEGKFGADAASNVGLFSEKAVDSFSQNIGSMLSPFDLLWVVLAVMTAWRIPRGLGIKVR